MGAWKHVKVLRDGVDVNVKILDSFATHVAPALGWLPNREGPVTGYLID